MSWDNLLTQKRNDIRLEYMEALTSRCVGVEEMGVSNTLSCNFVVLVYDAKLLSCHSGKIGCALCY